MALVKPDIDDIYFTALEKAVGSERSSYLDEVCGVDSEIRARVERLLGAQAKVARFLESPAPGIDAPLTIDQPRLEPPGTLIGRYKLLEQVGEGGMGVVYVAEQTEPVRRRVALKIIKPGMDTKQVIARFEAERQALAMMDHPNIARVLDAGTTEAARPYFVMELVRGMPITEYCDKARLSPRQRLELFVDVCQAVQHAHQKGIIHRDLKPSNVMVTTNDGRPVVKVIDFGVAKAVGQQLTERTVYTALTQLVGTPLYMSPEQAELTSNDVDTRSDVYSLGVLLYELLTGQTPFDKETLSKAGLDEMRRIIREDEPLRPSRRFSTLGAAAISTASQHRGVDERRLSKILCGELDWIVMKALEKDRSRRYESASALATDIQRYLSDEPVLACPPTTMYRFQKFARKHKPAFATAAAIVLCLLLGTTVSAWQAVRATTAEAQATVNEAHAKEAAAAEAQQRQRAEANEQQASAQRDEVKVVNDELRRTLYATNMNLAKSAWDKHSVSGVLKVLNQLRPQPGEPDLRGFEWHLLNRLCHSDAPRQVLDLKNPFIYSITYSPDGKRVFTATGGGTSWGMPIEPELKCWDGDTGKELFTLKAGDSFRRVMFSPDGTRFASAANEAGVVKVWDAKTGNEVLALSGHTGSVTAVAFSPDGGRLMSASSAQGDKLGELKVRDLATGRELRSLKGNFQDAAYSPDGQQVAYSTAGGMIGDERVPRSVNVLNAETGERLFHLPGGGENIAYSPNGKRLAAEHSRWNNAKRAFVGGEVKVWDSQTGQEIQGLNETSDGWIRFSFSPDGKQIAIRGVRAKIPRVKVCDTETGRELFTFQQHTDLVTVAAFSPDGNCLATGSTDGTLRLWDLKTGEEIRSIKDFYLSYYFTREALAFSPDGRSITAPGDEGIKIWDTQFESNPRSFSIDGIHGVMTGDFKQFASATPGRAGAVANKAVTIWSADSARATQTLKGYANRIFGLAFSEDGSLLASGDGSGPGDGQVNPPLVKLWDVKSGQELFTLKGHTGRSVSSLAFSPDGRQLATRGPRSELKMWDVRTGRELFTLDFNRQNLNQQDRTVSQNRWGTNVVFSPDGKRFAAGTAQEVKIFSTQNGAELLSFKDGGIAIAFSRDGKRLASGSSRFKVWDAETGKELVSSRVNSRITALAFSSDGKRLASASSGGTLTLWDAEGGQELITFEHSGAHWSSFDDVEKQSHNVAFSTDGHRLASVHWDGTVRIWDATPLPEKP